MGGNNHSHYKIEQINSQAIGPKKIAIKKLRSESIQTKQKDIAIKFKFYNMTFLVQTPRSRRFKLSGDVGALRYIVYGIIGKYHTRNL